MIRAILVFLGLAHTPKSLAKKSANVHSVFTSTVTELTTLNSKLEAEKAKRQAVIDKAAQEHADMTVQQEKNQRTVDKINQFFE